jgi:hypothetical protein
MVDSDFAAEETIENIEESTINFDEIDAVDKITEENQLDIDSEKIQ